jgi:hypothetical protein
LGPLVTAVLAVAAACIPLAIVTGKNATLLWNLFYAYCALAALGCVGMWVQHYYKAGGHLKNKAWQFYRALLKFASNHPQPFPITENEKADAAASWVRISGQYARTIAPRAYRLRAELANHGWASDLWNRPSLTHPSSTYEIRTTAEQLRCDILRLP